MNFLVFALLLLGIDLIAFSSTGGAAVLVQDDHNGRSGQFSSLALLSADTRTRKEDLFRIFHRWRRTTQWLQQENEECGPKFVSNPDMYEASVLGPANANNSIFQNIRFPNNESLDPTRLAFFSLYPLYVFPSEPFVPDDQRIGRNGEFTDVVRQQHELLTAFWNMSLDAPILLLGLHSEPLQNYLPDTVQTYYNSFYGHDSERLAVEALDDVVDDVRAAIEGELPGNYSNPALTQLAFFTYRLGVTGFENSSVMVFGDGLLDWVVSLGLSPWVGISFAHAHEFGHAVQSVVDLEESGIADDNTADGSRRIELEADAMGAYALAHDQGGNWSVDLLVQASRLTFSRGDCKLDEVGHHGTPMQRECATRWGADEGLDMKGDPVSMREFRELFRQNLESILALDPLVCTLEEDSTSESPALAVSPSSPTPTPSSSSAGGERRCTTAVTLSVVNMALSLLLHRVQV